MGTHPPLRAALHSHCVTIFQPMPTAPTAAAASSASLRGGIPSVAGSDSPSRCSPSCVDILRAHICRGIHRPIRWYLRALPPRTSLGGQRPPPSVASASRR
eukprot:5892965-Prymnesium_polylepis.1